MSKAVFLAVGVVGLCISAGGCVSFENPPSPYEANNEPSASYERIHDNMDTQSYNRGAGAIARGDKEELKRSLDRLSQRGGEYNRANAGILRALSTCSSTSQSPTPAGKDCAKN